MLSIIYNSFKKEVQIIENLNSSNGDDKFTYKDIVKL